MKNSTKTSTSSPVSETQATESSEQNKVILTGTIVSFIILVLTFCLALSQALFSSTPNVQVIAKVYSSQSDTSSVVSEEVLKDALININTADISLLQKLEKIGPKRAEDIIAYREKHGNFSKIEDIMKVSGIGEKTFEGIKDYITV